MNQTKVRQRSFTPAILEQFKKSAEWKSHESRCIYCWNPMRSDVCTWCILIVIYFIRNFNRFLSSLRTLAFLYKKKLVRKGWRIHNAIITRNNGCYFFSLHSNVKSKESQSNERIFDRHYAQDFLVVDYSRIHCLEWGSASLMHGERKSLMFEKFHCELKGYFRCCVYANEVTYGERERVSGFMENNRSSSNVRCCIKVFVDKGMP